MNGLNQEPYEQAPDYKNTPKRANHVSPVVAESVFHSRWLAGHVDGEERDDEACHVTQLVGCIAEDREGARNSASHGFRHTKDKAHYGREHKFFTGSSRLCYFVFKVLAMLDGPAVLERCVLVEDLPLKFVCHRWLPTEEHIVVMDLVGFHIMSSFSIRFG